MAITNDDIWNILDLHFDQDKILTAHQIESFNRFVNENIPDIIEQFNPIQIKIEKLSEEDNSLNTYYIKVFLLKPRINKPYHQENNGSIYPMYPNQARIRNFYYGSKLFVDTRHEVIKVDSKGEVISKKTYENFKIPIGKIPIMLQSDFCVLTDIPRQSFHTVGEDQFDYGGYFIVNGSEKVVVAQTSNTFNNVYLYNNGKGNPDPYVCRVDSKIENKFENSNIIYVKFTEKTQTINVRFTQQLTHGNIPIFVLFRALGVIPDKNILEYIIGDLKSADAETMIQLLLPSLEEALEIQTQEAAFDYLYSISNIKKFLTKESVDKMKDINDALERHLFPHIGKSFTKKAYYLGYMTRKLLLGIMEKIPVDDRDHLQSIRVKTTGNLLGELFLDAFGKLRDSMVVLIRKEFSSKNLKDEEIQDLMARVIKPNNIDAKFKTALSTGNWSGKGDIADSSNLGVAQVLKRLSYLDMLSHLRKVVKPFDADLKLAAPRYLNTTQWGRLCPAESPEGGKVGLVNNLAMACRITVGSNPDSIIDLIKSFDNLVETEDLQPEHITYLTKVLVNGDWIGSHPEPYKLIKFFKDQRRKGIINFEVSIAFDTAFNEIKIFTESGRFARPVFIVEDNKLLFSKKLLEQIENKEVKWMDLLTNNNSLGKAVIEYLDPAEEENALIAPEQKYLNNADIELKQYSHCEIHNTMLLGVAGTTIPFCDHNQAPRNVYQCAQVKQSVGIYATNFLVRFDKIGHILHYPQRSLVQNKAMKYINSDKIPGGINVVLAVATYVGFNQDDSLILNKAAVDRGLFHSTYYATYKDDLSKGNKEYGKPDPNNTIKIRAHSFRHIGDDGFIKAETEIEQNDVVIGKIQKTDKTSQIGDGKQLYTDESITLKDMGFKDKKVTVDEVIVSQNGEGYQFCKVRMRKKRIPIIGDKYSARHGQKGTIGMLINHEDMPFTKEGLVPDIIMNPHAFPKRMTIGQILELVFSKVGAIQGTYYNSTPFENQSIEEIGTVLENLGYDKYGNEVLCNGMTGEQLPHDIFFGPCYYQKLKHMVSDKWHSRSTGPVSMLTRQPLEGRSRDGGLRLGEMERDALLAHGVASFLKEKFMDSSDGATAKGLYSIIICKTCGFYAQANKATNDYRCKHPDCINKNNKYAEIYLPYATKTFMQELMAQCIAMRIFTEDPSI